MTQSEIAPVLDMLAAFPSVLRDLTRPLDDTTLRFKPEGEWSAIENVGHLIDIEGIWTGRFQQMLAAEQPTLQRFDVDELVRQRSYQQKQLAGLLGTFSEAREQTIEFLRGLKPLHLERTGVHPTYGIITLSQAIGIMSKHDYLHHDQIEKTVAQAKEK